MSGDGLGYHRKSLVSRGRVPDSIKSMRYVEGDGSDFMSGIEDLHSLLGEQKQQVQGGVTWSEFQIDDRKLGYRRRGRI